MSRPYEFCTVDGIACIIAEEIVSVELEKRLYKEWDDDLEEHVGDKVPHFHLQVYFKGSTDYVTHEFKTWDEGLKVYNRLKILRGTP